MSKLDRIFATKAVTRLVPEARPFRLDVEGAKEAVLLLHGFTGIPKELSIMGEALSESGYTVMAPRYPGHGTDRADFMATGAEDWVRRAFDSYLDLRSEYETVHVLGHSMGGLIATIVSATFNAPRLILLAPAFKFTNAGVALSPLISMFKPVIRKGRPLSDSETDPARRQLFADYWADDLVSGAAQLRLILKEAKRDLAKVHSQVLLITGEADEVVPPAVAAYAEREARGAASFEARIMKGAGHLFPFDERAAEAAIIVKEWMAKV
jgi:carboxylesterase